MRIALWFILATAAIPLAVGRAAPPATTQAVDLPKPTLVTLKLDHTPAIDALKQLLEQAGVQPWIFEPVIQRQLAGATVTANIDHQPFAQALLELCRQSGLDPQSLRDLRPPPRPITTRPFTRRAASRTPTTAATRPSLLDAPAISSGPFVFVARSATRSSQVNLDDPAAEASRQLLVSFVLLGDPKVRVMSIRSALDVDEARDQEGTSLLAPAANAWLSFPGTGRTQYVWPVTARLAYPPPQASKLTLRGKLNVTFVKRSELVELISAGAPAAGELKAGQLRCTVAKFEDAGETASRLSLTIQYLSTDPQAWNDMRDLTRSDLFRATHPDGGQYAVNVGVQGRNDQGFQILLTFHPVQLLRTDPKPPKKPAKVVWNVPVELEELAVPVEFKDLALP